MRETIPYLPRGKETKNNIEGEFRYGEFLLGELCSKYLARSVELNADLAQHAPLHPDQGVQRYIQSIRA